MAAAEQKCLCLALPSVLEQPGEDDFSGMQIGLTKEAFKREENAKIPSFVPVQDKHKDISKEAASAEKFLNSLIAEVVLIIDKKRCFGLEFQDGLISDVTQIKTNKKVHFSSPIISNVFEIEEEMNNSQDTIPVDSEEDLVSFDQCTTNSWYNFIRTKPSFDNLDQNLDKEIVINSIDNERKCTEDQFIVEKTHKNNACSYKFDDFLKAEQLIENENLVLQDNDFLKSQYVLKNDKLSLDEQTVNNSEKKKQEICRSNFRTKVQNIQSGFDALFINKNQTDSQHKENPTTKNTVNLLGGSISQELSSLIGKDTDEGKADEWYRKKVQQKFQDRGDNLNRPITCWCENDINNASRHDACNDEAENQFLLSEEQLVPNIDLESTTCLNYVKSEIFHGYDLSDSDLSLSTHVKDNLVEQINLSPISIENSEDSFYAQSLHSLESVLSQDSEVDLFSSNANIKDDEFNRRIGQEITKSGTFETVSEDIENSMMKFEQSERQTPPTRNEEEIASQAPVPESNSTEQHDEQKLEQCERQKQPTRNEKEIASQAPVPESNSTKQHDEQKLELCERQKQPTRNEKEIASQAPVPESNSTEQHDEQKLEQCERQKQPTRNEKEIASQAPVPESNSTEQHDEQKLELCERQTQPTRNEEEIASQASVSKSTGMEQHDEQKLEQCKRQKQPTRNEKEVASQPPVSESTGMEQHDKQKLEQCERQTQPNKNEEEIASQALVSESKGTEQHDEQKLEQCEKQTQPTRNEEEIASQALVSESKGTEQHDEQKLEQCERQTQPNKNEEEIASQAPVSESNITEQHDEQKLEQCERQKQRTRKEEEIASQAPVPESKGTEQHDEQKLEQCERKTKPNKNEEERASQAPFSESKGTEQLEQCERQIQPTRNEEELASQVPVSESKGTEQHEKQKLEQCERQTQPMQNIDDSKAAIQRDDGDHKTNLEVASPRESVNDDTDIYSYRKTEENGPKLDQQETLNSRHSNHTESWLIGQQYHLPHAISYTPEEDYIENSEGFEVDVNSCHFDGLFEADDAKACYTIAETGGGLQGFPNLPEGDTAQTRTISGEIDRQFQHITNGNIQAGISYTDIPTAASENALGVIKSHENLNSCVEDKRINLDMMESGSHQQQRSKKLRLERSSESPNIHVAEEKTAGEQQCLSEDDQVAEAGLSFTSETSEAGFYTDVLLTRKGTDKTPDQINISIPDVHEPPNKMKKKEKGNTLKRGDDNPAAFTWSARRKLFPEKIEINEEDLEDKSFYPRENNDQRVVPCFEATPSSKGSCDTKGNSNGSRGLRLGLSRRRNINRLHPYWSSARIRSDRQVVPDLAMIDDESEE